MRAPVRVACRTVLWLSGALLAPIACGPSSPRAASTAPAADAAASAPVGFVNRVWRVRSSTSVQPGAIYVFVSDGTLLMTSPQNRPALGSWTLVDGVFTMVEDGIPYRTDIVSATRDELKLRSHNPGEPVEITLAPAEVPPLPALGVR
jgi:hypothetical protein